MPKQISNIKVQGTIDGITYFKRNGQNYARPYSRPSKELLEKSPKFESFRRNQVEFGGAMKAMSGFREGFDSVSGLMFDKTLSNRVSKIFKAMIKRNQDSREKRPLQILMNRDLLDGFELNNNLWLNQVFKGFAEISINSGRNEITLKTESFIPETVINKPALASHFEIINHISVLSDYVYSEEEKGYVPVDRVNNGKYVVAVSPILPINNQPVDPMTITAVLNPENGLTPSSVIIASVGIRFYETHGGNYYPIGTGGAMKVKRVF